MRSIANRLARLERATPGCPLCAFTRILQDGDPDPPFCERCGGMPPCLRIEGVIVGDDGAGLEGRHGGGL